MKFGHFEVPDKAVAEQHWEKKPVYSADGKTHLYDEIKATIRVQLLPPEPTAEKAKDEK